jgi:hypothetical protein
MKFQPTTIRRLRKFSLVAVILLLAVAGVGLLPGRMEGQYRDRAATCGCDGVHFLQFREGSVIRYDSTRPPGELIGRYLEEPDGSFSIYHYPSRAGQSAELVGRAYPKLAGTKFVWVNELGKDWEFKRPRIGAVGKTVSEQQVTSITVVPENGLVRTLHDSSLGIIRQERLPASDGGSPRPNTGGGGR